MKFLMALLVTVFAFSFSAEIQAKSVSKNKEVVDVIFILDRSGSMGGLESDTIGGFNSVLEKQRKEEGKAYITTVLFDDQYELLHDRVDITKVKNITEKEYYVRGSTALLDAIGKTIMQVKANQDKKEIKDKVLFVIITDGMENASKEYNLTTVRRLIEAQNKNEKWEFIFLGANIDAIGTAENLGIKKSRAVQYKSDSIGTQNNYKAVEKAIDGVRAGYLDESWKLEIEKDVQNRGK